MRRAKRWTLDDLAMRSSLSKSFLSQVERGQSTLSVVSLSSICKALSISMTELLQDKQAYRTREEHDARGLTCVPASLQLNFRFANTPVNYLHVIGHVHDRNFDVIVGEIPPGYSYPLMHHDGDEFGYLLDGEVHIKTAQNDYYMKSGDCYYLRAGEPHSYETSNENGARLLMVTTQRFLEWEAVVKSTLLQFGADTAAKEG